MSELAYSLFTNLAPVFVLIMMGVGVRRLGLVGQEGTDRLSRAVIYFFFPILVFHRIALTENPNDLIANYGILIWAVVVLMGSGLIAALWFSLIGTRADRRTFVFGVAMPNWIFLPLAIAGPLWGDEAVRLIILFNVPTQCILWTAGIRLLRGSLKGAHAVRYILLNPGLLGTTAGVLAAFGIIPISFAQGEPGIPLAGINPALHTIGGLTIPLSIIALGLYLGERVERHEGARREVMLVTVGRLALAPALLIPLVLIAGKTGIEPSQVTRWVLYLIISMPVAMSVPVFVQLFGGDRYLTSRSVVTSTLIAFVTAPLFVALALKAEVWLGLADALVLK